jgi:hypothetical protein
VFADDVRATEGYLGEIALLEKAQGAERVAIVKAYNDQIIANTQSVARGQQGFATRQFNAEVTLGTRDPMSAALYAFDTQAEAQREDYAKGLTDMWGPAYAASAAYAQQVAQLETTLGKERLVVIQQITAGATTAATAAISALKDYAVSLSTSQASPLSPQARLDAAQRQFNAVSGAAGAGNASSIQQLQGYANTLLAQASQFYGSGGGYVAVFNQVVNALNKVATQTPDTLTASFLALETRTQTATLVEQLQALRDEVVKLRQQVATGNVAPGRIAA